MTKKTFKELWDELVPASGDADTVQGQLILSIGRLSSELYRNGYQNYYTEKSEHNRKLIYSLLDKKEANDPWDGVDDESYAEGQLREILYSGLFELDRNHLIELRKSFDRASFFDDLVNYPKTVLPEYAEIIERLRADIVFGATGSESSDVIHMLYLSTCDKTSKDYEEHASYYNGAVEELIEENPNIVPLIEELRPYIKNIPFKYSITEMNLEPDLDTVENIIVDYCNSHSELIDLKEEEIYT